MYADDIYDAVVNARKAIREERLQVKIRALIAEEEANDDAEDEREPADEASLTSGEYINQLAAEEVASMNKMVGSLAIKRRQLKIQRSLMGTNTWAYTALKRDIRDLKIRTANKRVVVVANITHRFMEEWK